MLVNLWRGKDEGYTSSWACCGGHVGPELRCQAICTPFTSLSLVSKSRLNARGAGFWTIKAPAPNSLWEGAPRNAHSESSAPPNRSGWPPPSFLVPKAAPTVRGLLSSSPYAALPSCPASVHLSLALRPLRSNPGMVHPSFGPRCLSSLLFQARLQGAAPRPGAGGSWWMEMGDGLLWLRGGGENKTT